MLIWIFVVVGLLAIDQISKLIMLSVFNGFEVGVEKTIPIIRDFFHFTYVENTGAVFGLGGGSGFGLIFFIIAAVAASIVFFIILSKTDFKDKRLFLYKLSISMLIAGALGNGIDRVIHHFVVDFIDFRGIWIYVFNFADICLTVGIAFFLFDQFILEPKRVKQNEVKE